MSRYRRDKLARCQTLVAQNEGLRTSIPADEAGWRRGKHVEDADQVLSSKASEAMGLGSMRNICASVDLSTTVLGVTRSTTILGEVTLSLAH